MSPLQTQMYAAFAIWAVLMYGLAVSAVRSGLWGGAVFAVVAASPLLIFALAVLVEGRPVSQLVNLKVQSWSFSVGDTFALTSAMVFATLAWLTIPRDTWYTSWWWTLVSAVLGLAAGIAFHVWDGGNYRREGADILLRSPSKIAHDFVAYPVLFGAIVCVGVPLLVHAFKTHWNMPTWGFVACLGVWVVLVVCDAFRGLNPWNLHPAWDVITFSPLRT